MIPTIALGLVALLLVYLWWLGRQPHIHRGVSEEELTRYFRALLDRGYESAVMFVRPTEESEFFLQFAKYGQGASAGIRFAFPEAEWSEAIFEELRTALGEAKLPVLIEDTGAAEIRRFLVVNIGNDLDQARQVAVIAFNTAGRVPEDLRVWFSGVAPAWSEAMGPG